MTPKKRASIRVDAPYRGVNSYWRLCMPKKGFNTSWRPQKWAFTSIEDQARGVDGHKGPSTPFEACWSRRRACPFFNKIFWAQKKFFFCDFIFFLHFEGCRILWVFSNLKILRYTIIVSMVHLFFHHFFWVSNWNILHKIKFFSYTLKGEEFDGKVYFCKKTFFPFLLVGYPQKTGCSAKNITGILFVGKTKFTIIFCTLQSVGINFTFIKYVPIWHPKQLIEK